MGWGGGREGRGLGNDHEKIMRETFWTEIALPFRVSVRYGANKVQSIMSHDGSKWRVTWRRMARLTVIGPVELVADPVQRDAGRLGEHALVQQGLDLGAGRRLLVSADLDALQDVVRPVDPVQHFRVVVKVQHDGVLELLHGHRVLAPVRLQQADALLVAEHQWGFWAWKTRWRSLMPLLNKSVTSHYQQTASAALLHPKLLVSIARNYKITIGGFFCASVQNVSLWKCRKELWLQTREALWSNCNGRSQANRFFF